jgi:hypothetical protein
LALSKSSSGDGLRASAAAGCVSLAALHDILILVVYFPPTDLAIDDGSIEVHVKENVLE